jgi:hypothetical protein
MIRLNMLLLFLIAVEPYLFNVLVISSSYSTLGQSVSAYLGLDIGGIDFVLAYLTDILTKKEKNLIPEEVIPKFKFNRNALIAGGAIFVISALPIFWTINILGIPLRILLWVISIPFFSISRFSFRSKERKK